MEKLLETQFECSGPKVEFGLKLLKMEYVFAFDPTANRFYRDKELRRIFRIGGDCRIA